MTPYQKEQIESLEVVRKHLCGLSEAEIGQLRSLIADYLSYRERVGSFLSEHFESLCSVKCFQSRMSACCSRDGIITFFADVVVNALVSIEADLARIETVLRRPHEGFKCVYLAQDGCLWRIKPIVCEMFLCDAAGEKVFSKNPIARQEWEEFEQEKKRYTWPDRAVIFDTLEEIFMDAGYRTALMYLHNHPGLLRIKQMAAEKRSTPSP